MFQHVVTISPLNALDYLIGSFDSDIITTDYRVRGFTRNMEGEKLFMDHSIDVHSGLYRQQYIAEIRLERYQCTPIQYFSYKTTD